MMVLRKSFFITAHNPTGLVSAKLKSMKATVLSFKTFSAAIAA